VSDVGYAAGMRATVWWMVWVLCAGSALAQEAPDSETLDYGRPEHLGTLDCLLVDESSGLAASHVVEGGFWTHNDSGGEPRLFLFGSDGVSISEWGLDGAEARDWEDMCSFERDGVPYLLVADTGDNNHQRDYLTLYLVAEPQRASQGGRVTVEAALRIRYAGGPHDCEGIGVDTETGVVLLVSKERRRSTARAYAFPLEAFADAGEEPLVLEPVADLPSEVLPMTTALDVSSDGRRAVVLTYLDAYEFRRGADETWGQAFARAPRRIGMPLRRQGESICYGTDGVTLYLTSEKLPTPLWRVAPAE
jgi:hypothetical protein